MARSRVAHRILAPEPDQLRHDARRAWRAGPRRPMRSCRPNWPPSGTATSPGWRWPPWSLAHRSESARCARRCPGSSTVTSRDGPPGAAMVTRRRRGAAAGHARRRGLPALGRHGWRPMPRATGRVRPWPPTPWPACRPSTPVSPPPWATCMPGASGTASSSTPSASSPSQLPTCRAHVRGRGHPARQRHRLHRRVHRCHVRPDRRREPRSPATSTSSSAPRSSSGWSPTSGSRCPVSSATRTRRRTGSSSAVRATPAHCSSIGPAPCCAAPRARAGPGEAWSLGSGFRIGCPSGCPTSAGSARHSTTTRCARTSTDWTSPQGPRRIERAAFEASGFVIRRIIDGSGVTARRDRRQWRRLTGHGLDGGRGRCDRSAC